MRPPAPRPQLTRDSLGRDREGPMRSWLRSWPIVTRRRMGVAFALVGLGALALSTASPTNYRDDFLDPRLWVRVLGVILMVAGILMVVFPFRGGSR